MTRPLPKTGERRLFPRTEAAYYLGISIRGMDQLAHDGEVPKVEIAGRVNYDRRDLDAYVERIKRSA